MKRGKGKPKKVSFYGAFGQGNFGNESTLQAIVYHLRRHSPDAEITCICTNPEVAALIHNVATLPIRGVIVEPWNLRNPITRFVRKVFVGIPCEVYRWFKAFMALKDTHMLIVPGTGLLTDAYGLLGWGPYNMLKWSLVAKLRGCKLLFVSVGAGPIYSALGRWLIKSALSLADFRSYRDDSSLAYLKGIGFAANGDRIYPDLAFSLPEAVTRHEDMKKGQRAVVGLGLMSYAGRYSVARPTSAIYLAYLENLAVFVRWLLAHEYDVRLLIGEIGDLPVQREFKDLLRERSVVDDEMRVKDQPASTVEQLFAQIATTDFVVATRFHNVLFSLILNKPVVAISFHHKCVSLMDAMGLSEYCQDIHRPDGGRLIEKFRDLEKNAVKVRSIIKDKNEIFRKALDEQYNFILNNI
jgi:polysaccharide pyruvyl transferase WcaK-like protein